MESKVFVKDPEGCTLKKGQDWVSEENVIDSMGIGVRGRQYLTASGKSVRGPSCIYLVL